MECLICKTSIGEGEKTYQSPCCDNLAHSKCIVILLNTHLTNLYDNGYIPECNCKCGALIWSPPPPNILTEEEEDERKGAKERMAGIPGMKDTLKKVRDRLSDKKKTGQKFLVDLNKEHEHFLNGANAHIMSIRNMRQECVNKVKSLSSYNTFKTAYATASGAMTRFCAKYNLDWQDKREIFGGDATWYGRYRRKPGRLIMNKFKVEIG